MKVVTNSCGGCGRCEPGSFSWKKIISAVLAAAIVVGVMLIVGSKDVSAQEKPGDCIAQETVANALEEDKCLVIFEGKVYDFTEDAKLWDLTGHVGQHLCGKEYDAATIQAGPHGVEVMDEFYIGDLCEEKREGKGVKGVLGLPAVLGVTWRRLSSWLALVFFILNFATCYAMPWARGGAPWAGERPGKDAKDQVGHFPLTHWHGTFAWLAIFFLSVHGLLLFLCVLWGKCF